MGSKLVSIAGDMDQGLWTTLQPTTPSPAPMPSGQDAGSAILSWKEEQKENPVCRKLQERPHWEVKGSRTLGWVNG